MTYHLKIKDQYDAFTCRTTGLRLNCFTPEARTERLSHDIEIVLRSGRVLDVNGKAIEALNALKADAPNPTNTESDKEDIGKQAASVEVAAAEEAPVAEPAEESEAKAIGDMNKEELLSYIEENGLDQKKIGISPRMGATRIQEELLNYLAKGAE